MPSYVSNFVSSIMNAINSFISSLMSIFIIWTLSTYFWLLQSRLS
jgi:hypothetical protein